MGRTVKKDATEPKKSKAIAKSDSEEAVAAPKARASTKSVGQPKIFSESFYEKIRNYNDLLKDILDQKSKIASVDVKTETQRVVGQLAVEIEAASAAILFDSLKEHEKWITESRKEIQDQVKQIKDTQDKVKQQLVALTIFTEAEVNTQLQLTLQKAKEREQSVKQLEALLNRISEVAK